MMRCLEEYGKQWRPKQRKSGWQSKKRRRRRERRERTKERRKEKEKPKKNRIMEVKKVAEEWEI